MEHDAAPAAVAPRDPGPWPLAAGVASAVLLAACVKWAHHFGLATDLLIGCWALATAIALGTSLAAKPRTRATRVGLTLALVSVAALVFAGAAFAFGGDPTGGCGGG